MARNHRVLVSILSHHPCPSRQRPNHQARAVQHTGNTWRFFFYTTLLAPVSAYVRRHKRETHNRLMEQRVNNLPLSIYSGVMNTTAPRSRAGGRGAGNHFQSRGFGVKRRTGFWGKNPGVLGELI